MSSQHSLGRIHKQNLGIVWEIFKADFENNNPGVSCRDYMFAEFLGISQPLYSMIKNSDGHKTLSRKIARQIESRVSLPKGWMDQNHDVDNCDALMIDGKLVRQLLLLTKDLVESKSLNLNNALFNQMANDIIIRAVKYRKTSLADYAAVFTKNVKNSESGGRYKTKDDSETKNELSSQSSSNIRRATHNKMGRKVAFNFRVPSAFKHDFEQKAIELGFTRVFRGHEVGDLTAMLYHCAKSAGVESPAYLVHDEGDSTRAVKNNLPVDCVKNHKKDLAAPIGSNELIERYRQSERVSLNYSVPESFKLDFEQKAVNLGFIRVLRGHEVGDQIAMLYHCAREAGINVPESDDIDGRRHY